MTDQVTPITPITTVDGATDSALTTIFSMWNNFIDHLPYIGGSVTVVLITWLSCIAVTNYGSKFLSRWQKRDSVKELILRLFCLLIWTLGLLLAAILLFPGLTPTKAIGGLGLLSIAVGLAFKDIFENFFAGILLLWRFPFEDGDFIECNGLQGKVEKVLIRMTYLRNTNGELVVVPNSFLFKNPVKILTSRDILRTSLLTGVSYDSDISVAVDTIKNALQNCATVKEKERLLVLPCEFGSSSVDIEVHWWTDSHPIDLKKSRAEVVVAIKQALDKESIDIPFPQRTLTFSDANVRDTFSSQNQSEAC